MSCLLQEIMEVEQIMEEDTSLPLTEENIERVLDEIRPYLVGGSHIYSLPYCRMISADTKVGF